MTDERPGSPEDDEQDPGDWLGSLFDPTGESPAQPPAPPATPPARTPPPLFPPAAGQQPPPAYPPAAQPPQQPPAPPAQPSASPQTPPPAFPAAPQQPAPQPPVPPQPAPAQPIPPAQPAFPQQPPAPPSQQGGFSWGLSPGGAQPSPAGPPPASPPAQSPPAGPPPAAPPPAQPPPAAPPPATWFEPELPPPVDPSIAGTPPEGQPPAEPMPFETAALPGVAPDARDAPPFWEPEPTQMMDAVEVPEPRQPPAPAEPFGGTVFPAGTELLPEAAPVASAGAPPGETQQLSALDALFGESQFREYEGIVDPSQNPFARRDIVPAPASGDESGGPSDGPRPPAAGVSRLQRVLLIVLGSVLAVLAIIALFFLGMRLPDVFGPAPAVTAPSASPSPSASPIIVVGPVAPGEYHWDELLGGECLDPFEGAWQDTYTVVDCETPHAAQMVITAEFSVPEAGPDAYPGEDVLQANSVAACRNSGIFSPAAGGVPDAQLDVSFPVSEEDWDAGNRRYYCFVSRSSGEQITGDITVPQPTPTPAPVP